jgi:hypothetical protein
LNIFLLDTDIVKCAQYHCDKHVVKMPIEYAQLLSTALIHLGREAPYLKTHENHPCAVWARLHNGNYTYLYDLAMALGDEYTYRYGRVHASTEALYSMPRLLDDKPLERSPLPNCTSIKADYPQLNLVDKYRLYYLRDKAHILTFKDREEPEWMGHRFYQQQLEAIGTCPGDGKPVKIKKLTKAELAEASTIKGIEKLLLKDIEVLQEIKTFPELVMPEGRLKAPYAAQLSKVSATVSWTKLTIADMKTAIESVINARL